MIPLEIVDFCQCKKGTVVIRSAYWKKEHFWKKGTKLQLGILVGKEYYEDAKGSLICWPVIHWEGAIMETTTHPVSVALYRKTSHRKREMYE